MQRDCQELTVSCWTLGIREKIKRVSVTSNSRFPMERQVTEGKLGYDFVERNYRSFCTLNYNHEGLIDENPWSRKQVTSVG